MIKLIVVGIFTVTALGWWYVTVNDEMGEETEPPVVDATRSSAFPALVEQTGNQAIDRERVRAEYAKFLFDDLTIRRWTTFTNGQGVVALSKLSEALDLAIEPGILRLLDEFQWQLYRCPYAPETTGVGGDIVLSLRFSLQNASQQVILPAQRARGFELWEQTLLADVAPVLYPVAYYQSYPQQQGNFRNIVEYSQVGLREVPVVWLDGRAGVLGYVVVGDELLVGTSRACLLEAQELLFDTSA